MGATQLSFLEELEPRIAPATFVMGSDGSTITGVGADANLAEHQTVDAKIAGYDNSSDGFAFLFKKGDKLVFDSDGDELAGKTEPVVLSVTAGAALVFFTDHDNDDSTAFAITGVAMGDKFSGVINADVHGSLFTALGADGHLSYVAGTWNPSLPGNTIIDIQNASISNVTVNGFVDGTVFVGGSISGLKITGVGAESTESILSAQGIFTGTAINNENSAYNLVFGGVETNHFIYDKTGVGGSISNVEIAGGVKKILAGEGVLSDANATNPKAKALAGGSISNVTLHSSADLANEVFPNLEVRAGNGSQAGTITDPITGDPIAGNAGGAGGSVSGLTVKYGSVGQLTVQAGHGNHGGYNAAGGAGGAISTITASVVGATIFAGDGGDAGFVGKTYDILDESSQYIMTGSAAAGVGGSVTGVTLSGLAEVGEEELTVLFDSGDSLDFESKVGIFAGNGGEGGAAGGSVNKTTFLGTYFDEVAIQAGNGSNAYAGTGKAGGASGSIAGVTLKNLEIGNLSVGIAGNASTLGGNGAEKFTLKPVVVDGDTFYTKTVTGGGVGGAGGSVSGIQSDALAPGKVSHQFIAYGGFGGTGAYLANGGVGGAVSTINLLVQGEAIIQAGYGGGGGVVTTEYAISDSDTVTLNSTGASGAGGSVSKISLKTVGSSASNIMIIAGSGSSWSGGTHTGGAGGNVSEVTITGNQAGLVFVGAGLGGSVMENSGRAGAAGGNVSKVSVTLDTLGALLVNTGLSPGVVFGSGSDGAQKLTVSKIKNSEFYKATYVGTAGGAGGSVTDITLLPTSVAPDGAVQIFAGIGGNGSANEESSVAGNGGAGGKVEKVYLNAVYDKKAKTWNPKNADKLVTAPIQIVAGSGGNGNFAGAGGVINEVRMFTKDSEIELRSGDGGDGYDTAGSKDGAGGNISNLSVISAAIAGPEASSLLIRAGDAGKGEDGENFGLGAAGGSISNLYHAAAYSTTVAAGHGSNGLTGGVGGSITGANLFSKLTPVGVLEVNAGNGGEGLAAAGGAGGSVSKVIGDNSDYISSLPTDAIVPPSGSISVNEPEGYAGDLIISDPVTGAYLNGGSFEEPDFDSYRLYGNTDESSEPMDQEISGEYSSVEIVPSENAPINDVNITATVYGDISISSGYDEGNGAPAILGDVNISGQVDRIILNSGARIEGDLTITGPNNGVWIRTYVPDPENEEEGSYELTEVTDLGQLAGIVDGAFSNTGTPLGNDWELPTGEWQGAFTGNVTFENGVYGPTYISGRVDGDVTFSGEVYAPIYLTVYSNGSEEGPISTSIGGDLVVSGNNAGVFVQLLTWDEGSEEQTIQIISLDEWLAEDYYGLEILGSVTIEPSEPSDATIIQAWQVNSFALSVNAGHGGNGTTLGGAGGSVNTSTFSSEPGEFYYEAAVGFEGEWRVAAGDGGDASSSTSAGGAGGNLTSVNLYQYSPMETENSPIQMLAGHGGDGQAKGGVGGSITKSSLTDYNESEVALEIVAGNGGTASGAPKSVAGAGGSISGFALSTYVDANLRAGSAGATGAVGAVGGSITSVQFFANGTDLSFTAGNGGAGGAGGSIDQITEEGLVYPIQLEDGSYKWQLDPSFNNLSFAAGHGSFTGGTSGAGGSIKNVTLVAPYVTVEQTLVAGDGAEGTKPGVGGVIENIKIVDRVTATVYDWATSKYAKKTASFDYDYLSVLGSVTLQSGNGGNHTGSGAGAKGGDVKNVQWNLDYLSRILTLGQGGDGTPDGNAGVAINVNATPNSVGNEDGGIEGGDII